MLPSVLGEDRSTTVWLRSSRLVTEIWQRDCHVTFEKHFELLGIYGVEGSTQRSGDAFYVGLECAQAGLAQATWRAVTLACTDLHAAV